MRAIAREQKEIETRMETVDKSLEEVDAFIEDCEKYDIPQSIIKALWKGENSLSDERYYLSSELFELSQKIAETLFKILDIDKAAKTCCKKPT